MSAFPRASATAVGDGQGPTKRAGKEIKGMVMMPSDGSTFVVRQFVTETIEYVNGTTTMSTSVTTSRLAKVMEECSNSNTISRQPIRVGEHVFINFIGVPSQSAMFLMMAIASTIEVGR